MRKIFVLSPLITLKNITIIKEDKIILDGINLEIYKGDHILLTGSLGAGKSLLMSVIAGRTVPTSGEIIKSESVTITLMHMETSLHKVIRPSYQYYQQRYQSMDSEIGPSVLDIFRNQIIPLGTVDMQSVELPPSRYTDHQIMEIAHIVRIDHLLNRKMPTLSNGETKRVWLALSMIAKPDILLLDNPFTGLDVESRVSLKSILENVAERLTVIMTGVNNKDLPKSINNVISLKSGQIVNLLKQPSLKESEIVGQINIDQSIFQSVDGHYHVIAGFNNVNVVYDSKHALKNINVKILSGSRWGIIGPNGSGKTTFLSLINGDHPQSYNNDIVLFDRKRGTGESIWDIKSKIGFVSPELQLYFERDQPVWKVVASGLFDTIGLFRKLNEEHPAKVDKILSYINILHLRDRIWHTLSMGEQRIVLLARALIKNPPLLILDESCQNLDDYFTQYFIHLIDSIMTNSNRTLLYVSHVTTEIPSCIDHTLYLKEGDIEKIILKSVK